MGNKELYESASGDVMLEVRSDADTVWLTRHQVASLFGRDVKTIGKHIAKNLKECQPSQNLRLFKPRANAK